MRCVLMSRTLLLIVRVFFSLPKLLIYVLPLISYV